MRRLLPLLHVVTTLGGACAHRPPPEPSFVAAVQVHGPDAYGTELAGDPDLPPLDARKAERPVESRRTAYAARRVVTHRDVHWWQFLPGGTLIQKRAPLDPEILDADAERMRVWFRDRGWGDATVAWETRPGRSWWLSSKRMKQRYVEVDFQVVPGPREIVADVAIDGIRTVDVPIRSELSRLLPPRGTGTSDARRAQVVDALRTLLARRGRPLAQVRVDLTGPLEARREVYVVELGPTPRVGRVTVTGTTRLDPRPLERALTRAAGKAGWNGDRIAWAVAMLAKHPEIASVAWAPAAAPDAEGRLDWTVHVLEAKPTVSDTGTSLSNSGALLALGFAVDWQHRGIGGQLAHVGGYSRIGYRFFDGPGAGFFTQAQHGPATEHKLELEGTYAPLAHMSAFVSVEGMLGTYRGQTEVMGRGHAGLRWRPGRDVLLSAWYQGAYHRHFPWPWQTDEFARAFSPRSTGGVGLDTAYSVQQVGLRLDVNTLNAERLSTRGVKFALELDPYGWSEDVSWTRMWSEIAWFATVIPDRFVVVTRAQVGLGGMHDDGDQDALLGQRFFLGGPASMRGFGYRRLGPPGTSGQLGEVMVGGDALLYGSVEGRVVLHPDLVAGVFFDVGRTWESIKDRSTPFGEQRGIHLEDVVPVLGFGGIASTPVGRLEGWLGFRLVPDSKLTGSVPIIGTQWVLSAGKPPDPSQ